MHWQTATARREPTLRMVLVLLMLLGSDYPYNWVTDHPYSTVDIRPEAMKREGYHPPPNVSLLHPPRGGEGLPRSHRTGGSDAAASPILLPPSHPLTRRK